LQLQKGRRQLRSSTVSFLQYLLTGSLTSTYGRQAFSVAGLTIWNSLPDFIPNPTSSAECRLFQTSA